MNPATTRRIIVCDDDARMRNHLKLILKDKYDVSLAKDGEDLLFHLAQDSAFDLIFLDNNMPVVTGLEALPQIKKYHPEITVVMISGDSGIKEECLSLGASYFISKPLPSIKEIQEKITEILSKIPISEKVSKRNLGTLNSQFHELIERINAINLLSADSVDQVVFKNIDSLSKEELIKILNEFISQHKMIEEEVFKADKGVKIIKAYLLANKVDFEKRIKFEE